MGGKTGNSSESFTSKVIGATWNLGLFVGALVIFAFFHTPRAWEQTFFGMIVKCLPIVALQIMVYKHGLSSKDSYGHKILTGGIFGCIGDAFLDFPGLFIPGVISFALGHFFYISAFGFTPLKLNIALPIFGGFSLTTLLCSGTILNMEPFSTIILALYSIILKTMIWRSIAQALDQSKGSCDTGKVSGGLGGFLFGISDSILAFDRFFYQLPPHIAHMMVMSTYYAGQFFISLSVFRKQTSIKDH